jgi:hypothetical protein
MSLLVFEIFDTSQMIGSAQKCPNRVKRDQKGAEGAKIDILRTFGRRILVDTSFQSQ